MSAPLPNPQCVALNRQIEETFPNRFAIRLLDEYHDAALIGLDLFSLDERFGHPVIQGERASRFVGQDCSSIGTLFAYHKYNCKDSPFGRMPRARFADTLLRDPGVISTAHNGSLRGKRCMLWVTLSADLINAISDVTDPATQGRNLLGLAHHSVGTELVRFDIPKSRVRDVRIPTFVDGSDNAAFCMWSSEDQCGLTWRLDCQAPGLPEGVVEPVELDSSVRVQFLGKVLGPYCPSADPYHMLRREETP